MSFKGHYPEWHTVLLLAFHWPECSQIGNVFFEGVHCCSTYNWDSVSERKMRGNIGKTPRSLCHMETVSFKSHMDVNMCIGLVTGEEAEGLRGRVLCLRLPHSPILTQAVCCQLGLGTWSGPGSDEGL